MCLILFGVRPNEHYRLVVAANRDEFYGRPARRADFWEDEPGILAGRDLEAKGTWLGVSRSGRFAAVTNVREDPPDPVPPRTRGDLPRDFLAGDAGAEDYLLRVAEAGHQYRGFNLVVDDGREAWYYSNRIDAPQPLAPGFYGLSNQLLDCDWPKVNEGRDALKDIVSGNRNLSETRPAMKALLLDEGDGRPFSNPFINTAEYGTCAASLLLVSTAGEVSFTEYGFSHHGQPDGERHHQFKIER